jgi:hypothetical protein
VTRRQREPWVRVERGAMGDRLYITEGDGWNILAPAYSTSLYLVGTRSGSLVRVEPGEYQRARCSAADADAAVRRFLAVRS